MVMKRCIYGVDLNPMATELAKLSLWLDSFTVGAPLSFLDHHLKVGNSLVGARVEDVRRALEAEDTGQIHMFAGPFVGLLAATELMRGVATRTDATFDEVEESTAIYADFEEAMLPYKRVLDLWVSRHFGNEHADEFLRLYGREALEAVVDEDERGALAPHYRQAVRRARELWREKHFFHWELEFPEAFIDLERGDWKEEPGFDTFVSNPPYVSNWELTAHDNALPAILEKMYEEVATGHWDLYILFIYRALNLTTDQGAVSFIVPSPLAVEKYGIGIREFLLRRCQLCTLVDFGESRVFEEISRQYLIFRAAPHYREGNSTQVVAFENGDFEERASVVQNEFLQLPNFALRTDLAPLDLSIRSKMIKGSIRLGSLCCVNPGVVAHSRRGSPVKFRKDDVIHRSKLDSGFKKYVEGRSMDRYEVIWEGLYIDYTSKRELFHRPKFPELFESPKIMFRGISGENNRIISCYDVHGYYTNHSVFHAITWTEEIRQLQPAGSIEVHPHAEEFALPYVTAIVNSSLMSHYFSRFLATGTLQGSYSSVYPEDARKLPIRRIDFTTPADERERLVARGIAEAAEWIESAETPSADSATLSAFSDSKLGRWLDERLTVEPQPGSEATGPQTDVVHDLLAHLAGRMISLHEERRRLEKAADPFKFLDRGAPFVRFTDAFADEVKYGELIQTSEVSRPLDPGVAHHDVDGLRLVPGEGRWELQAQLKLRDPDDGWQSWQYDESGHHIARRWVPVYRLPLSEAKARYYRHAFQVLDAFANARPFPGGYTRTTLTKLQLAHVPAFDPQADLTPLVELSQELAQVRGRIERTDALIDRIVYRLYGLTDEEIAVVEGA
jgi:hypothetical protein